MFAKQTLKDGKVSVNELFKDNFRDCVACGSLNIFLWDERRATSNECENIMFKLWKCRTCQHIFINPPPSKKLLEAIYSKSGHGLREPITLEQVIFSEKQYPNATVDSARLVAVAKKNLKIRAGKNMEALDIGSGYGFYAAAAKREGFTVTAINPSVWENDVFEQMNGFRPIQSFFEDVNFSKKFNLVLLSQILEHIDEPLLFLNRVRSVLSDDGVVAIAVPNLDSYWVKLGKSGGVFWIPEHLSCFTKKSLIALLSRADFKVVNVQGISRIPYFALSDKLGLKGRARSICNLFTKTAQYVPLRIFDKIGWSGGLNIWAKKGDVGKSLPCFSPPHTPPLTWLQKRPHHVC